LAGELKELVIVLILNDFPLQPAILAPETDDHAAQHHGGQVQLHVA
jgi:hypothetical protein